MISYFDMNNIGMVDYTEFLAASLQSNVYLEEVTLRRAFSFFDKDKNGKITVEEMANVLRSDDKLMISNDDIAKLIAEVDQNKDQIIDYNEFLLLMK